MTHANYLLIGGGLASHRASQQIRARDAEGRIVLVSNESLPPYDRPPLSKEYLKGTLEDTDLLFPSLDELGVVQHLGSHVTTLDPTSHRASCIDGTVFTYDKALIATGGRPLTLTVPGARLDGVYCLRSAHDAATIRRAITPGCRMVIVGGGFIGLEAAASLTQAGVEVVVIESAPALWSRFAHDALSRFVRHYCEARGVGFRTDTTVTAFTGATHVEGVTTTDESFDCDLAVCAVGIQPNIELAAEAGLAVADGVVVDSGMRTSDPDVFAAGDVISYPDPYAQRRRRTEHWGHAEHSGQIAGRNMAGDDEQYRQLSYVWSEVFDLRIEFAGDEGRYDRVLIRGTPEVQPFSVFYVEQSRVTAYFAVNEAPRTLAAFQKLIRRRTAIDGREDVLQDPGADLRTLV